jgi:phosphoribosylformylglycinamidine cyclo-ligase
MSLSYRDAGVDIDAGEALVKRIKPLCAATRTAHVLGSVGGFAGLCKIPPGLAEPILVSGTDGVGTKLKLAFATGVHDTVGIDLVAMCINDILTTGAQPLFFLDYFGTGKLQVDVAEAVVRGIAEGCKRAGCALLGGETAELPDMYAPGEYDLAGFAVGVVDRPAMMDGSAVVAGDRLVAVASSGLHSNGYSLARRVLLDKMGLALDAVVPELQTTLAEALLEPTLIYANLCKALAEVGGVHAYCHITGGGLVDNLPRVFPKGLVARIDLGSYERPALFQLIEAGGPVTEEEMRRTFNLGVGLVAMVAEEQVDAVVEAVGSAGYSGFVLGEVAQGEEGVEFV